MPYFIILHTLLLVLSTPERYINSAALDAILARIVRTALADYRGNRYCPGKPSAREFLVAMGLVDPVTGVIDYHGYRVRIRKDPT